MADKEVTTFVLDITTPLLSKALPYVTDIITTKALRGRKTDYVASYINGTQETTEVRDHITLLFEPKIAQLEDVKHIIQVLGAHGVNEQLKDDTIMALLVAALGIHKFTGKKKFKKNIVLVTGNHKIPESLLKEDVLDEMCAFLNENSIKLVVVGVDFDDGGETVDAWSSLSSRINDFFLMSDREAIECIELPAIKPTRPAKLFETQLRIGANLLDPALYADADAMNQPKLSRSANKESATWIGFQEDESCVSIPVEAYSAVKIARGHSMKRFGVDAHGNVRPMTATTEYEIRHYNNITDNLNEVENADDDLLNHPYESELVERDALLSAYRYGKSSIVLPPILNAKRQYKTIPGMDIRGVIENSKLPRVLISNESILVFGSKNSTNDQLAIAAIVDTLSEMESSLIARFAKSPTSEVEMVVLQPSYIPTVSKKRAADKDEQKQTRVLVMNRLPMFEDEKIATFPLLTNLKTTSGEPILHSSLIPSSDAQKMMDLLVETMDLGTTSPDFDGDKMVFNPTIGGSLLPLPGSKQLLPSDELARMATGIHRLDQAMKQLLIQSCSSSLPISDFVKEQGVIPPIPPALEKDTVPDPALLKRKVELSEIHIDHGTVAGLLKRLTEELAVKPIEKSARRKRKVVDEIQEDYGADDGFVELSLDELLGM